MLCVYVRERETAEHQCVLLQRRLKWKHYLLMQISVDKPLCFYSSPFSKCGLILHRAFWKVRSIIQQLLHGRKILSAGSRERWKPAKRSRSGGLLPALPVISNNKNVYQYLHSVCGVTYYYYQQFSFMRATLPRQKRATDANASFLVWPKCAPLHLIFKWKWAAFRCFRRASQMQPAAFTTGNICMQFSRGRICCFYSFLF